MTWGHVAHPWLGELVQDTCTGRSGTLRAVCPEPSKEAMGSLVPAKGNGQPVAWLAPPGGGREWTAPVKAIRLVGTAAHVTTVIG